MFIKSDDVRLVPSCGHIKGIINNPKDNFMKLIFGKVFKTQFDTMQVYYKYYGKELKGKILAVGKRKIYIIKCTNGKVYVFSNKYHELKKTSLR